VIGRHGALYSAAMGTILLASGSAFVCAGDVEVTATVGYVAPTYSQSLSYSLGDLRPLPGVTAVVSHPFQLDAKGGFAGSASLTWYLAGPLGLEGRLDLLNVDLQTVGAVYEMRAPSGTPVAQLQFGGGPVAIDSLRPLSLNLRLSTSGPLRFALSGGMSRLPAIRARSTQSVHVDLVVPFPASFDLGSVALGAEAGSGDEAGLWGANGGITIGVGLSRRVALVVDARGFVFPRRTLRWKTPEGRPPTPFEEALLAQLSRASTIEFNPVFVNATFGVAFRF